MEIIENLHWEMSVLSRAVGYGNLSAASLHVGLSQPQLSRIVQKIESHLGVMVLDRTAKRKAAWTPEGRKLAETYATHLRSLTKELSRVVEASEPDHLRIGTLEGLVDMANGFASSVLAWPKTQTVELDVYDISDMEEHFSRGYFDFILSFREPGRKKFRYTHRVGYQNIQNVGNEAGIQVVSTFEYQTRAARQKLAPKTFVSNSLEVRRKLLEAGRGHGLLPSPLKTEGRCKENDAPVLLIGAEHLPAGVWNRVLRLDFSKLATAEAR